jgi:site-specific recombinase XerD
LYEPHDHKTKWRGHQKLVPLGPKAQRILRRFLDRDPQTYLFSPQESEEWRRANRAKRCKAERKTPVYPSELRSREKAKAARENRKPKRIKHERYDTASYRRAITYGVERANKAGAVIGHWHPNQLRHSRGTEVRKKYGIEAAQVVLGHARADVTQVYAEKNLDLAKAIAKEAG